MPPRTAFHQSLSVSAAHLWAGALLLLAGLLLLASNALGLTQWFVDGTPLEGSGLLAMVSILFGGVLDLLALCKTELL